MQAQIARQGALRWGDVLRWLLFPLVYIGWTLLHGTWLHWCPYPFIDVDALGVVTTLRNSVGMLLLFAGVGTGLVALDRVLPRRETE